MLAVALADVEMPMQLELVGVIVLATGAAR
jgi:hypothetical protein